MKNCQTCRWMRQRQRTDIRVEAGYACAEHWCHKNDMPTVPLALRCGGDDWEAKPTPQERQDAEAIRDWLK